ncbi:Tripartite-type tricarboxylate transporter, receptor component TctC [Cupriavidus sp. YR651]|uniref:tripartite tricarboxylate transporter substrate binding protein n=1 Tax=Cupriavidus sp. YR651 TaxID=1855315 RepID=UPI00087E4AC4|nr:tripartite tricarboxylate transporter substrate binding protein [Cupriavidus sp. YR651]SDC73052.1 Tripartite-type tricarboxylate transporter, receptor component TctC [Cupriavidus sp. YR651]
MTPLHASRRHLVLGALALAAFGFSLPATAESYPTRRIELIVPWQAGGGADVVARALAAAAAKHLPQPIVVINKPGATGAVGLGEVVNARPDGYKLVLSSSELTFLNHLGLAKFTYQDLVPIARLNADPAAVVVRADAPWATLEQFLADARKPGANIRVGTAGQGSAWHMASAALAEKTGARFNDIPYAGGAPATLALLGGHIDAVTVSTAEVAAHVEAGKLKVLAVMADRRVAGFENVPTLKERNIDLSMGIWRGISAPKGTPPEVLAVLKAAIAKSVQEPIMRQTLEKLHFSTDTYADDVTLQAEMARESVQFRPLAQRIAAQQSAR